MRLEGLKLIYQSVIEPSSLEHTEVLSSSKKLVFFTNHRTKIFAENHFFHSKKITSLKISGEKPSTPSTTPPHASLADMQKIIYGTNKKVV